MAVYFRFWPLACLMLLAIVGCGGTEAQTPLDRGQALLKEGQWEAAARACDKAIAANPSDPAGYVCRGKANLLLTRLDNAIDDFTAAIRLAPEDAENYYQRAIAYKELGYIKNSVADERQARKLDSSYVEAFLHTPEVYGSLPVPDGGKGGSGKTAGKRRRSDGMPADLPPVDELLNPDFNADDLESPNGEEPGGVAGLATEGRKPRESNLDKFRQNRRKAEPQTTTVPDLYGQPIVIQNRTATEELLGIELPKPDDPVSATPPNRPDQARDDRSGRAADRHAGEETSRADDPDSLDNVPRLSPPTSTAIGPPLQGVAPPKEPGVRGRRPNSFAAPSYPLHSPYIGDGMRSTGLQQAETDARGPVGNTYSGTPYANPNAAQRPNYSPYNVPLPARGRRDVSGGDAGPGPYGP